MAKLHPDFHVIFEKACYSAPRRLIGKRWKRRSPVAVRSRRCYDPVDGDGRTARRVGGVLTMGRVRTGIQVNGRRLWTLFDSGAENTYVLPAAAALLRPEKLRRARKTRLGGKAHTITRYCLLVARVDGKTVEVHAYVIDRIGRDRRARREFDVLFGARAMQDWGIELNLKRERLDMSGYPGEFVEF